MATTKQSVYTVVFTGGPCAGKTSALEFVMKSLQAMGYRVYTVPEIPTILMSNGPRYPGYNQGGSNEKLFVFETNLLNLQLSIENSFGGIAETEDAPTVIIHDRGLLDVKAYLPEEMWHSILSRNGWTEEKFLGRYNAVLHLVTAADGAEKFLHYGQ